MSEIDDYLGKMVDVRVTSEIQNETQPGIVEKRYMVIVAIQADGRKKTRGSEFELDPLVAYRAALKKARRGFKGEYSMAVSAVEATTMTTRVEGAFGEAGVRAIPIKKRWLQPMELKEILSGKTRGPGDQVDRVEKQDDEAHRPAHSDEEVR